MIEFILKYPHFIMICAALLILISKKLFHQIKKLPSWIRWKKENQFVRRANKKAGKRKIIYLKKERKKHQKKKKL